jgi:murein L,D-transpeptidase YcbB/YkuD
MPSTGATPTFAAAMILVLAGWLAAPAEAQDAGAAGGAAAAAGTGSSAADAQPATASGGSATSQTSEAATGNGAAQAADAAKPADPIIAAARTRLTDAGLASKVHAADLEAMSQFYNERTDSALWISKDGLSSKGALLVGEIAKAADWGLEPAAFEVPAAPSSGASPEALAEAEVKLSIAALRYARFARGGRLDPRSLSRILDLDPPVKSPKDVLAELAVNSAPDAVLRALHPRHEQFERLRQALLKARGRTVPDEPAKPALLVKLPAGKTVRPGQEHADVALLRKRLEVPAEAGAKETLLDARLADALEVFQLASGLQPTGALTQSTRTALNAEGEPKRTTPEQSVQRLIVNMEKWRWMPESLGAYYVWSNVPEFQARVIRDGKEVFKEKIIAGQPEWATPTFSAAMQYVVFNPSWGVPDGIKQRELLPRLQRAGGGGFFDQLFGGGGGGAGVLAAYGLTAYRNGKPVDPNSVDWSSTDIRNYSFTQPPGAKNPLGFVKFRFPNKHDVYMHDTTQRELFAQSYRALSHGCMRVQNPRKLADIVLLEDKGWSPDRVQDAIASSGEITLDKPVPVHVTYFTAIVDEAGKVSTFGDLYGHDTRITAALGKPMRFDAPRPAESIETASTGGEDAMGADAGAAAAAAEPGKKKSKGKTARKRERSTNDLVTGSLSGLISN